MRSTGNENEFSQTSTKRQLFALITLNAGQILLLTGGVDARTLEKYEKEAKDKNREGWYMAYIMDTNEEERLKGITVEVSQLSVPSLLPSKLPCSRSCCLLAEFTVSAAFFFVHCGLRHGRRQ